ncbi:MAG TPA: cation-transporting P-type ATPase, partial [Halomonas sp.]|nr:cation-transporting P-type ATPase [Halomonas sp.]
MESSAADIGFSSDSPPEGVHAWHSDEVIAALETSPSGLTADEAKRRLARYGRNQLPAVVGRHPLPRFFAHFHNALIYFLLAAAVAASLLAHFVDATVIIAVVLVNAVVGFVQEGK